MDEKGKTETSELEKMLDKAEIDAMQVIVKHIYVNNSCYNILSTIHKISKTRSGKVSEDKFQVDCINDFIESYKIDVSNKNTNVVGDFMEIISYLKLNKVIYDSGEKKKIIMPLNLNNIDLPEIAKLEEKIENITPISHLPYHLAETIYKTSNESPSRILIPDFIKSCMENYEKIFKETTTGLFDDLINSMRYLTSEKIVRTDNGHFVMPLRIETGKNGKNSF